MSRLVPSSFASLSRLLALIALLFCAPASQAQWLVYETSFETDEATSVNFSHYTGGYLIAPLHGGRASVVFVTSEGGQYYAVAENSARFYIAANAKGSRAVFSATTQVGTAVAMYQASGPINSSITYSVPGQQRAEGIAASLTGLLMASDDESTAPGPAADGSLGMVGTAIIQAKVRSDLSAMLNKHAGHMTDAVDLVVGLLEQIGYVPDTGDALAEELPTTLVPDALATAASEPAVAAPATSSAPAAIASSSSRQLQHLSLPVTPSYAAASAPELPLRTPLANPQSSPATEPVLDPRLFPPGSYEAMEREASQQAPQYRPYLDKK